MKDGATARRRWSLSRADGQAAGWLATRALNGVLGLAHAALVVAAIGASDSGRFFVLWTGAWIVATVARFGVDLVLPRSVAEAWRRGESPPSARNALAVGAGIGALIVVPVLVVLRVPLGFIEIACAVAFTSAWVVMFVLGGLLSAHGAVTVQGLVLNVIAPLPGVLAAAAVLVVGGDRQTLALSSAAAAVAAACVAVFVADRAIGAGSCARLVGRGEQIRVERDLVAAAGVGVLWQIMIWLPPLLGAIVGVAPALAAGLYAAARVAGICSWPYAAVVTAATPQLAAAIADHDRSSTRAILRRSAWRGLLVSIGPCAAVMLAAAPLLRVFDHAFAAVAGVLTLLAAARLFDAATGPLAEALVVGRRAGTEAALGIGCLVVGIIVTTTLYPAHGVMAIGFGVVCASVSLSSLRAVLWLWLLNDRRYSSAILAAVARGGHAIAGGPRRETAPLVAMSAVLAGVICVHSLVQPAIAVPALLGLAAIAALIVVAFIAGCPAAWELVCSPLTIVGLLLVSHFVLRPVAILADDTDALWGLRMIGISQAAFGDALLIGIGGFCALAAGMMGATLWVPRAEGGTASSPAVPWIRIQRVCLVALTVGTIMWLALFLRLGGPSMWAHDPTSIHLGQAGAPYGVVGLSICIGVSLVLLLHRLRHGGGTAATVLLLSAAVSATVGSLALATRGQLVGGLVAAAVLVTRERRPSAREAVVGVAVLAVILTSLMTLRAVRGYSTQEHIGGAIERTVRDGPLRLVSTDLTEFDSLVALRELSPDVLPALGGRSLRDVVTAPLPRALWPGKPRAVDLTLSRTLYGPETLAGTPFTLPGELWWNAGLGGMLGLMVLFGAALGACWQRWAPRAEGVVVLGLAVVTGHAYLLFTRPLAPMILAVAIAAAVPMLLWSIADSGGRWRIPVGPSRALRRA